MTANGNKFLLPEAPFKFLKINDRQMVYEEDFQRNRFQIVLVGDADVGKSTYLKRLKTNEFDPERTVTTALDIVMLFVKLTETKRRAKLAFYDVVGQDIKRIHSPQPLLTHSDAAVAFFDATRPETFESLRMWKKRLDVDIESAYYFVVVCNKIDLLADEGELLIGKIEMWREQAKKMGARQFILISAKDGTNCSQLCYELITAIFNERDQLDKSDALTLTSSPRMLYRDMYVSHLPMPKKSRRCLML